MRKNDLLDEEMEKIKRDRYIYVDRIKIRIGNKRLSNSFKD